MADTPHYHGHRQRLRQRLQEDPTQLADYEVLELLLGYAIPRKDTKPIAKSLLARFATFKGVMLARPGELKDVPGLGAGAATFFILLQEARARFDEAPAHARERIEHPVQAASMAMSRLGHLTHEEVWVALLDIKNRIIGWERVATGAQDAALAAPRDIVARALARKAIGVILVHNHPGGGVSPSRHDEDLTAQVKHACQAVGLRLLDHLIVTDQDYFSFQMRGAL